MTAVAAAASAQAIAVPHLAARVGYAIAGGQQQLDATKPTLALMVPFCSTVDFYGAQLASEKLQQAANLVAIEPLGHGATTCDSEHFTYWDSALAALQALRALGVEKAYVLGASQGGWIAVRMALLRPDVVLGLITLGTSMDAETADSRSKGCWDPAPFVTPFLEKWRSIATTPDFVVGDDWIQPVLGLGLGAANTPDINEPWTKIFRRVYSGAEGLRKLRMATICIAERDGLLYRLGDVKCPIHWLHGTDDPVFGTVVPAEHIKLFTGSKDAKLEFLEGGCHFLNISHPKEAEAAILAMVTKS